MCRLCRTALLQYLIAGRRSSGGDRSTVREAGGRWQPLCAVYRREFADAAEKALRAGRYKIDGLFGMSTQVVEQEELEALDFRRACFGI